MKGLTKQDKDAIRDALMAYCENFPSRNRASESLQGVSAAVVSQILNTKYESISDDMFSRIAAQIDIGIGLPAAGFDPGDFEQGHHHGDIMR